jgi:HlyD family secretion protein
MEYLPAPGGAAPVALVDDDPAPERRAAWIMGGLFFVGFLGFAALVPLDAAAYAPGLVAVSGNRQAVQHRDGGVVTALNVREGDRVRKARRWSRFPRPNCAPRSGA